MPTALITGASRGIGLELTRQYLADGWLVHAGARQPGHAPGLSELASSRLVVHRVDVTRGEDAASLAASLGGAPVDLLINNAGIWYGDAELYGQFSDEAWIEQFRVHVIGVMTMVAALQDNVAASEVRTIINISSGSGSFGWQAKSPDYPYNSSKAALNMLAQGLAVDLRSRGIIVVNLTPGFVSTDMTGHDADLDPATSDAGMRQVITGLDHAASGSFL
ncbi:MAG: SDR family oxidoreductase, partial [Alphaproteobacteria bacterium]|nr:SDR family oxidoreductase [Alphaproteobacteria bacterium]